MSTPTAVPPIPEETKRPSEPARMLNVFVAPRNAFEDMKAGARWPTIIVSWLLISATMLIFAYAVQEKIGYDNVVENRMRRVPKIQQMLDRLPDEQRSTAYENQVHSAQRSAYLQPLMLILIVLVVGAVQMGSFNFGLGASFKYRTCIAIVMLGSLPMIVRNLLATVSIYAGVDPGGFNFDAPLATNLGAFFDFSQHPYISTFGSFIDLFMLWSLALTALGFAVAGNLKFTRSLIPVVGWYLLFALAMFGLIATFAI